MDKTLHQKGGNAGLEGKEPTRQEVGVWIELPPGARWSNEGMTRLVGFMVEGAARDGGPRFHLLTPPGTAAAVRSDMRSLRATEDTDWVVHDLDERLRKVLAGPPKYGPTVERYASLSPTELGRKLATRAQIALPYAWLKSTLRLQRFPLGARIQFVRSLREDPHSHLEAVARFVDAMPFSAAKSVAADLHRWRERIEAERTLSRPVSHAEGLQLMADYANDLDAVKGWIVLHPFFRGAEKVNRPRAVIFPDAIPLTIPPTDAAHWQENGAGHAWRETTKASLAAAPAIITFSDHVATRDLAMVWNGPASKVRVIPHAVPDVSDHLPLFNPQVPGGDTTTRRFAADLLRAQVGYQPYLRQFPFEEVPYVVISTQDRTTKNLGLAAEAMRLQVRERKVPLKLFMTAHINYGASWSRVGSVVDADQLHLDICSVPDLPRPAHAALYHCAKLAIHPALFEGGHGPFPFYEALSVGCPCIMARGPHTQELAEREPELRRYMFDAYDPKALADLMQEVLFNRSEVLQHQLTVLQRLKQRTWGDVARDYAAAAIYGGGNAPDRRPEVITVGRRPNSA